LHLHEIKSPLIVVSLFPPLGRHFLGLLGHLLGAPVLAGESWGGFGEGLLRPGSWLWGTGGFTPVQSYCSNAITARRLHLHDCIIIIF
jgi:hypothetical protein